MKYSIFEALARFGMNNIWQVKGVAPVLDVIFVPYQKLSADTTRLDGLLADVAILAADQASLVHDREALNIAFSNLGN